VITEHYQAARKAAVLAEKDWFGVLKLTGAERKSWLQGMVTNDVQKLAPGEGCYAAHLNPQGRMIGHMVITADDDALWLSLERASIAKVHAAFDKLLIMEDVRIVDTSDEYEILSVIGPKAQSVIEAWLGESVAINDMYSHRTFGDCRVLLSELGYDIWVVRERADKALRALAQIGATAIDHGAWDVLRTEAGIPVYGVDVDETTMLPELGERGISYEKGCYIGQEVVAKVKYIGHVNRRFTGFVVNDQQVPVLKSPIRRDGKEIGYTTTTLFSPGLNRPIGLGFVTRSAHAAGTAVEILSEGKMLSATISDLPFTI
jgi:folate-binding protein YgfZ